jgi:hypothetical protein
VKREEKLKLVSAVVSEVVSLQQWLTVLAACGVEVDATHFYSLGQLYQKLVNKQREIRKDF